MRCVLVVELMFTFTLLALRCVKIFYCKPVKDIETFLVKKAPHSLKSPLCCAFRSRCQPNRKRESQHRVNGCCASRNRLRDLVCHTTNVQTSAHRKSDQRRVYLCEGEFISAFNHFHLRRPSTTCAALFKRPPRNITAIRDTSTAV